MPALAGIGVHRAGTLRGWRRRGLEAEELTRLDWLTGLELAAILRPGR